MGSRDRPAPPALWPKLAAVSYHLTGPRPADKYAYGWAFARVMRGTGNAAQFLMCQLPHAATFTLAPALSHDLQKQRDEFALAMRVRLGKDGFQLIARRLP